MAQNSEASCNSPTNNKGFAFLTSGSNGRPSASLFPIRDGRPSTLLFPIRDHPHSTSDSTALIHRSHAFSYNPHIRRNLPRSSAFQQDPGGNTSDKERAIHLTLVTADSKPPKRAQRRSSLFYANIESQKQLQVSVLTRSSLSFSKEHENPSSVRRSPRRYSAAQGSLDDISQDAAIFLQKTYTTTLSNQHGEFQINSNKSLALGSWASSTPPPLTWGNGDAGQVLASSSWMSIEGVKETTLVAASPLLTATADVSGNAVSASTPIPLAVDRNHNTFPSIGATTILDSINLQRSLTEISMKVLALPSTPNVTGFLDYVSHACALIPINDNDTQISVITQCPIENLLIGTSRPPCKILSAIASSPSTFFILNGGLKTADGNVNQNLPASNRNQDPERNAINDDNNLLETIPQDGAMALNSMKPEIKTYFIQDTIQVKPRSSKSTDPSSVVHVPEIDSEHRLDNGKEGQSGVGLFSWAWRIRACLGATRDREQMEVSQKDLNIIAPSSF